MWSTEPPPRRWAIRGVYSWHGVVLVDQGGSSLRDSSSAVCMLCVRGPAAASSAKAPARWRARPGPARADPSRTRSPKFEVPVRGLMLPQKDKVVASGRGRGAAAPRMSSPSLPSW
jgi:hypothetical protein